MYTQISWICSDLLFITLLILVQKCNTSNMFSKTFCVVFIFKF